MGICLPVPKARGRSRKMGAACVGRGQLVDKQARGIVLLRREALAFDQDLQYLVQHRVGRQAVLVLLARRQLGRRRLVDDGLRNDLAARAVVDVAR